MSTRVSILRPPFDPDIQSRFDRIMPAGVPPLSLFKMMAGDRRLFDRMICGSLLDKGNLTLRQREIVIDRVTARCGSEYEWGVHIAFFADKAGLSQEQIYSLVHGSADDGCWPEESERCLIRLCDSLEDNCDVDDVLWRELNLWFSQQALLEAIMLCGSYRQISYLTNAARLKPETGAARFPARR